MESMYIHRVLLSRQQPGPPVKDDESSDEFCKAALGEVDLVFFDGRLTIFAQKIAALARLQGIPIIVEAERPRDDLDDLLTHAGLRVEPPLYYPLDDALMHAISEVRDQSTNESRPRPVPFSLSLGRHRDHLLNFSVQVDWSGRIRRAHRRHDQQASWS